MIDNAPDILRFVIPGFFCVKIVGVIAAKKISSATLWIWSIAISYISVSIVEAVNAVCGWHMAPWYAHLWYVIVSVAIGVTAGVLYRLQFIETVCNKLLGITTHETGLGHVVDWKNGSNLMIYLKGEDAMFLGHAVTTGDENDQSICIRAPIKYDLNGNELFNHETDNDISIVVDKENIKYIMVCN